MWQRDTLDLGVERTQRRHRTLPRSVAGHAVPAQVVEVATTDSRNESGKRRLSH
jgi:hypothetical protein